MLAVFTYANELGLEPGVNSPEITDIKREPKEPSYLLNQLEKSVRCLLVFYMTALCKASLKVATMQRNISGILNVTRNFIPYPLLQTPFY